MLLEHGEVENMEQLGWSFNGQLYSQRDVLSLSTMAIVKGGSPSAGRKWRVYSDQEDKKRSPRDRADLPRRDDGSRADAALAQFSLARG